MERIGLAAPSAQQASTTSWQRRSSSGLARCTEAKSSSALDAPVAIDDAAPPPRPISIAGPPSTIRSEAHTSELQSLMRNSYAGFCLKKKTITTTAHESI